MIILLDRHFTSGFHEVRVIIIFNQGDSAQNRRPDKPRRHFRSVLPASAAQLETSISNNQILVSLKAKTGHAFDSTQAPVCVRSNISMDRNNAFSVSVCSVKKTNQIYLERHYYSLATATE